MRQFSTEMAAELTGASIRQLDSWARSGLLKPSGQDASGRGSKRGYTFEDLVAARSVVALREGGCSLQKVRRATEYLKAHFPDTNNGPMLSRLTLLTDGESVYLLSDEHEITEVVSRQMMMAVPAGWFIRDMRKRVEQLPQEWTERVEVEGQTFHLLLSEDAEEGGYTVQCRELPGAIEQGETPAEAVEAGKQAIESVLVFQRRRGQGHVKTG